MNPNKKISNPKIKKIFEGQSTRPKKRKPFDERIGFNNSKSYKLFTKDNWRHTTNRTGKGSAKNAARLYHKNSDIYESIYRKYDNVVKCVMMAPDIKSKLRGYFPKREHDFTFLPNCRNLEITVYNDMENRSHIQRFFRVGGADVEIIRYKIKKNRKIKFYE